MTTQMMLVDIADDFQNDYLTTEGYAIRNGLTNVQAIKLITLAQEVRKDYLDAEGVMR